MLHKTLHGALDQIGQVIETLARSQAHQTLYAELGVGRHVRHVADHLQAFVDGAIKHRVDFNFRTRESETERSTAAALLRIQTLQKQLDALRQLPLDHALVIVSEISFDASLSRTFQSTVAREILYLINHTIHHAAYIKLMLAPHQVELPAHIGLAPCTVNHVRPNVCVA